ncbi:MAG: molybdopterin molybdotransferase MoeA [Clostridia bacterium]|nr:molybdopterin molybdotransferase MoeA [Clostridia bacterium]
MNHDILKAPTKEEALAGLFAAWTPAPVTEEVPLAESLGRVAACDITAVLMMPLGPISKMDGYAVKSQNFANGTPDPTLWVRGTDYVVADTGDDVPDAYDTVIEVEKLYPDAKGKLMFDPAFVFKQGGNIMPPGCRVMPGDLLCRKNTRITPEIKVNLALGGVYTVPVIKKAVVAFIPTGNELVPVGQVPQRGETPETNSMMTADYLRQWGAEPMLLPIVRDDRKALDAAIRNALERADIVLINGGTSKGSEDFNAGLVEETATYFAHSVRTVPGRPVGIGLIGGKPVIDVPGPIWAAWTVNDWLVRAMVCRWLGLPMEARRTVEAELTIDRPRRPDSEQFLHCELLRKGGKLTVTPLEKRSRTSVQLLDGTGLLIGPLGHCGWKAGDTVTVELTTPEECIRTEE